jgi:rubrerythrin
MNSVKVAPKNIRSKVTKSIISDLKEAKVEVVAKEAFFKKKEKPAAPVKAEDKKPVGNPKGRGLVRYIDIESGKSYSEFPSTKEEAEAIVKKLSKDKNLEIKKAFDPEGNKVAIPDGLKVGFESKNKKPSIAKESQNARISWMNDIVNPSTGILKGKVPADWTSRKSLSSKSNAELWDIRGKVQRMATSANADAKVKSDMSKKLDKGDVKPGSSMSEPKATMETGKIRLNRKAVKESHDHDLSLSICPLCGSAEFDASESACPVCGESYKKYRAVEAEDFDLEDNGFTTIDVDGEDKILIDEDGNTEVVLPDQLKGKLVEHTYDLIIEESEDGPIAVDSGVASDHEEPDGDEDAEGNEPISGNEEGEVAFLKFPIDIEECLDLLQEANQDSIEIVATESGYDIILNAESTKDELLDELADGEEPAEAELSEVEEAEDLEVGATEPVVITLEEMALGTIVHVESISNISELVDLVNELLPEDAELVSVEAVKESNDDVDLDLELDELQDAEAEDLEAEDDLAMESAKPKVEAKTYKIVESGTINAVKGKELVSVKLKAYYEAELPKLTKTKAKGAKDTKVPAKAPGNLESTMEELSLNKHQFMKLGMEALGSGLNERKLLLSLWDAIKENKGNAKALLNTLEAAVKDPEAKDELVKVADKVKKDSKKSIKKMDKVVKFSK